MSWFPCNIGGGSSEIANILKGISNPVSTIGENGQLYLKYVQYEKHSFMDGAIIVIENKNDPTDIKLYVDGLTKDSSFLPITDTDLLAYLSDITSGYLKACSTYDTATSTTATGILAIGDWGSGMAIGTYVPGWSQYKAGTFYGVIDLNESPVPAQGLPAYQDNPYVDPDTITDGAIIDSFAKVSGAWQDLIGTNVNDIQSGGGSSDVYTIEQGDTLTAPDETTISVETDKLYMFFTGNHSGRFVNANVLVGNTSYFEIISGIGIAVAIIQATSNTMTYDGAYSGDSYAVEVDILKNGIEDLSAYCIDRASSWTSGASISANIGDYYLIADTVNNESGTIIGADTLIEETLTHPVQPLNAKIRIIKATATAISLSSGNNLYYRRFSLLKQI